MPNILGKFRFWPNVLINVEQINLFLKKLFENVFKVFWKNFLLVFAANKLKSNLLKAWYFPLQNFIALNANKITDFCSVDVQPCVKQTPAEIKKGRRDVKMV